MNPEQPQRDAAILAALSQASKFLSLRNYVDGRTQLLQAALELCRSALAEPQRAKMARFEIAAKLVKLAQSLPTPAQEADARDAGAADDAWIIKEKPSVRFSDIAGLDEVKEAIRIKLIYPFLHPDKAAFYGVKKGGGVLLYGPPGTGKTMIAKATAGEIDAPFFNIRPSDVMSKWVGEAEQNIRKLFKSARTFPQAVIFIDEVEALIPKRRTSGSTVMQRVVPQLLAELEGFEDHETALLFIGATNEPWSLDTAVLRPGRFDKRIYVPLPALEARLNLLTKLLAHKPLAEDVDLDKIAAELEGYSGADIKYIVEELAEMGLRESIYTNTTSRLTKAHLTAAIAKVKPSVDAAECRKYLEWQGN